MKATQEIHNAIFARIKPYPACYAFDLKGLADFMELHSKKDLYRGCGWGYIDFNSQGKILNAGYCKKDKNGKTVFQQEQSVDCLESQYLDSTPHQNDDGNWRVFVNFSCWQACIG